MNSARLTEEARALGFARVGVTPAADVPEAVRAHYLRWLSEGGNAEMQYLANHQEKRFSPTLLVPGVKSIVSLAMSYHPTDLPTQEGLAWYAQGADYHDVMRQRLSTLMERLGLTGRAFADTAPVLEKYWAWACGLGFIGRHTQLVIPGMGSAFFLGELFVEEEADEYDVPLTPSFFTDRCGKCHRCEEACPTQAIADHQLTAERCLSYLTIEHRGDLPEWAKPHIGECFYGCDRCLRACPHLHATASPVEELRPKEALLGMKAADWAALTEEQYRALFKGSAVKRAKYAGLVRNIKARGEGR